MAAFACSPRNPFRVPHWRWDRAGLIVAETVAATTADADDPWIAQAVAFRQGLDAAVDQAELDALFEAQPVLFAAHELWKAVKGRGPGAYFVNELQARLLIRDQSLDAIALRMGLDADDVLAFEQVFFAVRDKLDNRSYVIQQVIGDRLHSGGLRLGADRDVLWKIYAYTMGGVALDRLIDTTAVDQTPIDYQDLISALRDEGDDNLAIAYALAARTVDPTDKFKQPEVIAAYHKAAELAQAAGGLKGQTQAMAGNVAAMLEAMRFEVVPHGGTGSAAVPSVAAFEGTAAELRGDELITMALGAAGPDDDDVPPEFPSTRPANPGTPEARP